MWKAKAAGYAAADGGETIMRETDIRQLADEAVAETGLDVEVLSVDAAANKVGEFIVTFSEGYGSLAVRNVRGNADRGDIKTAIMHHLLSGPHE